MVVTALFETAKPAKIKPCARAVLNIKYDVSERR